MQWAKAKSIILIILAALNIFLAVNLYIYNSNRVSSNEAAQNALAILSSRNIKLNVKLPKISWAPKRLNFINDGYNTALLVEKLMGKTGNDKSALTTGNTLSNGSRRLELHTISFIYTDSDPDSMSRIIKTDLMDCKVI